MKPISSALLILLFPTLLKAQIFHCYKINVGPWGSTPVILDEINNRLLFTASTNTYGNELWATDGTDTGTYMVKDIYPAAGISSHLWTGKNQWAKLNNKIFCKANNSSLGDELWQTDGTEAGTNMVKNIATSHWGSDILSMFTWNGKVYFSADDGHTHRQLWVTDGTSAGTKMLKQIYAMGNSDPYLWTAFNNRLYFVANDGVSGFALWETDGTTAGTKLIKDINSKTLLSTIMQPVVCNNRIVMGADDGVHGMELWVSDGTTAGTKLLKDIWPGSKSGFSRTLYSSGDSLLFVSCNDSLHGEEFWVTDGTDSGTYLVKDINPGLASSQPTHCLYNGKGYFSADDNIHGRELWVSDGTDTGTTFFYDLNPGAGSTNNIGTAVHYLGKYYFSANNGNGDKLFQTDRMMTSIQSIAPTNATDTNPEPRYLFVYDSTLYFSAHFDTSAAELWSFEDTTWKLLPTINISSQPNICIGATNASLPYTATTNNPSNYSIVWNAAALASGFVNITNAILQPGAIHVTIPTSASTTTYTGTLTVSNSLHTSFEYPIKISIDSTVAPVVTISVNPGVQTGPYVTVTFSATTFNGGNNPVFEWRKNGVIIPNSTDSTLTATAGVDLLNNDEICVKLASSAQCPLPDTVIDCAPIFSVDLKINDADINRDIELYPNPNDGTFLISGKMKTEEVNVEISNNIGQIIFTQQYKRLPQIIRMHEAPDGMYFLRIKSVNGITITRFTICK